MIWIKTPLNLQNQIGIGKFKTLIFNYCFKLFTEFKYNGKIRFDYYIFIGEILLSYSTDDCKDFLIQLHPGTDKKDWKRIRKYKNELGQVARDFVCGGLSQTLVETSNGLQIPSLSILGQNAIQSTTLPDNYQDYLNQEDFELTIFGNTSHTNKHLTSDYEKFKHVLRYGIDWNDAEGKRSLYDFSQSLDFNTIVLQDKTLLDYSILYASGMLCFIYDLDETYMPHHCTQKNFDDSLPDLNHVISRIKEAYLANNMPLIVQQEYIDECLKWMDGIDEMMDEEESMLKKARSEMKKFKTLLSSFQSVSPQQIKKLKP